MQQLAQESNFLTAPENVERTEWGFQPRTSAFCGYDEGNGWYEIAQVKNAAHDCGDYSAGPPPRRTCATCIHLRSPACDIADAAMAHDYMTRATWDQGLAPRHTTIPQAQQVFSAAGAVQAMEMTQARKATGDINVV